MLMAFVQGKLSAAECQLVEQFLRSSWKGREYVRQLRVQEGQRFRAGGQQTRPRAVRHARPAPRRALWLYVAAAILFASIGACCYLVASPGDDHNSLPAATPAKPDSLQAGQTPPATPAIPPPVTERPKTQAPLVVVEQLKPETRARTEVAPPEPVPVGAPLPEPEALAAPLPLPPPAQSLPPQVVAPVKPEPEATLPVPGRKSDPLAVARLIDQEIRKPIAAKQVPVSPRSDDAEFCRRVHLDITGLLPKRDRVVAFLDSRDPDKRRKLIDELLASPDYGRNFADIWRNLTVSRDGTACVTDEEQRLFAAWLADGFNKDVGWDRLVTQMLTAQGQRQKQFDPLPNPELAFLLGFRNAATRQAEPELYAAAVSELFLGLGLKCAQCHNHKFVKGWKQTDFWGLAAFFGRVRVQGKFSGDELIITEADLPPELLIDTTSFRKLAPPMRGGLIGIPDPKGPDDRSKWTQLVKAKYFDGPQPVLPEKGPYLPTFAAWLTSPDNKFFARAAVNRLWKQFFARGLINPVEDMSPNSEAEAEPVHVALLGQLAAEFVAAGFDQKHIIRCLCNSETYQRTSRPLPGNREDDALYSHMPLKVMRPEVLYDALSSAMGYPLGGPGMNQGSDRNREKFAIIFGAKNLGTDPTEFRYGVVQFLDLHNGAVEGGLRSSPAYYRQIPRGIPREKLVEELYLMTLSRRPTPAETKLLSDFIARGDPNTAGLEAFKVLLSSAQFVLIR
jgi:hypothetical protein